MLIKIRRNNGVVDYLDTTGCEIDDDLCTATVYRRGETVRRYTGAEREQLVQLLDAHSAGVPTEGEIQSALARECCKALADVPVETTEAWVERMRQPIRLTPTDGTCNGDDSRLAAELHACAVLADDTE